MTAQQPGDVPAADVPAADVPAADVKVLFLAGKGRSGGTLLAALLGQLPGFFNIGELNRLWDWGLVSDSQRWGAAASDYRCGCGERLQSCPTWHAILERADLLVPELAPLAEARIDRDQAAVVRWSQTPRLLRARAGRAPGWSQLDRYTAASSAVYRAITEVTGAHVVIDSSRLPIEPVGLGLVPGVDVYVTQLVRDPRAVVYSWKRVKRTTDLGDDGYMPRYSASYTTTSWLARNLVTEVIGRRHAVETVQYDDLARDPAGVLRRLAEMVGEPAGDLAFLTSETATIVPTHSVGGNPMRMTSGAITIEPDEEWRARMEPRDRVVSTTIALPLLHHYGMPVRTGASPPRPTLTTNAWLRFDAIRHGLRVAQPKTVLEIGAGEGGLGSWLASQFDYTAVELDEQSRAAAAARIAAEGRGSIHASLDEVANDDFDLACAFEVLEHIADDEDALKQWHDHIRPSGWLLLSVPAHVDHYGAADELVGHYRRYERDALRGRLEQAGFEVVRFSSYGAGLGQVLQRVRNTLARRRLDQRRQEGDTPEDRSSGSGRLFQPKQRAAAVAFATVAAPARLLQAPFAATDVGTGYVVLAAPRPVTPADVAPDEAPRATNAPGARGRRVLVIGTFDPNTPRARQWLRLLERLECKVEVRNVGSWGADRASRTAGSPVRMLGDVALGLLRAAWYLATCRRPDVVVFLYPGHLDACVLGPIARLRRIPAVLDVFISLYDTVISDRGLRSPRSPVALATRGLDVLACWSVPLVVVDTPEHADFFARFTHRGRSHFGVLWVGAEELRFVAAPDPGDDAPILWYLTYIPLHGFDTVARAAALLADDNRTFRLVGDGQERARAEQLASELGLANIEFVAPVAEEDLPAEIARSSICLGVFGTSDKAARVVPNKVFQCAAAGRAVVTAASPSVVNAFDDALVTVPAGDAPALAAALRALRGPARVAVADRARATFEARYSEAALADDLDALLASVIRR